MDLSFDLPTAIQGVAPLVSNAARAMVARLAQNTRKGENWKQMKPQALLFHAHLQISDAEKLLWTSPDNIGMARQQAADCMNYCAMFIEVTNGHPGVK